MRRKGAQRARTVRRHALAGTLLVAACSAPVRVNGQEPGFEMVAVDTSSGEAAAITLVWDTRTADPRLDPGEPLVLAAWDDGTVLWNEGARSPGESFRRITLEPAALRGIRDELAARIETLPAEQRSKTSPDGPWASLIVRAGSEWLELTGDGLEARPECVLGVIVSEGPVALGRDDRPAPDDWLAAWSACSERLRELAGVKGAPADRSAVRLVSLREL